MSSVEKIYSGLSHEVQLWVAIAEIGTDAIMHNVQMASLLTLKPCVSVYSCSWSNSSGWVWALMLQVINALHNKRFGHTRLFSMCTCTTTANRSWMLCQFTNKHLIYYHWTNIGISICSSYRAESPIEFSIGNSALYATGFPTFFQWITGVQTLMYTRKLCVKSHLASYVSFLIVWIVNL